jgi:hypothetical protein
MIQSAVDAVINQDQKVMCKLRSSQRMQKSAAIVATNQLIPAADAIECLKNLTHKNIVVVKTITISAVAATNKLMQKIQKNVVDAVTSQDQRVLTFKLKSMHQMRHVDAVINQDQKVTFKLKSIH